MDEAIKRAIDEFHERFYPEAKVEFLGRSSDGKLAFLFSGHMCLTCGMSDYFVDFLEILNTYTEERYDIYDMRELVDSGEAWVVLYAPERIVGPRRKKRAILFNVVAPGEVVKVSEFVVE